MAAKKLKMNLPKSKKPALKKLKKPSVPKPKPVTPKKMPEQSYFV